MALIDKILRDGKCFILAYDQGLEHGPTDFNDENVDPNFVVNIGNSSGVFTALALQAGVAEKYSSNLPLIIKLNGKTSFHKGEEPVSLQLCSVDEAKKLGAVAVGYTIYVGSEHEEEMMQEFRKVVEEAHSNNMAVVAWMYPRGKHVEGKETDKDVVAYAARMGLELGADMVKLPYTGDSESFSWVVKAAGKTLVVAQGGSKKEEVEFMTEVKEIMQAGAVGMAIGRNVWQSEKPEEVSKKIADVIFNRS